MLNLVLGSNNGKEHVECNLNTVDKNKSVFRGNELEVHSMDDGPDLPRSLATRKQVVLDLVADCRERVSIYQSKVGKEDSHENGTPNHLVKNDFHRNRSTIFPLDNIVQPVVEVVT